MEEQLKEIMGQVFSIPSGDITEQSSLDTIEDWDSLKHTHLIIALEQGFGVSFEAEEIVEMISYKLILMTLKEKMGSEFNAV